MSQITTKNITNDAVTNAKLADMSTQTIKGRTTGGTGNPEDLTATQTTAILNNFVGDSGSGGTKGLVPAPASGDATKFLKGDGTWSTAGSGITSINGDTAAAQSIVADSTGTDFTIATVGGITTVAIPSASATNRGLITTGTQTIAGTKTFSSTITGTTSGNTAYTANNHGVVISGSGNTMTVIAPDASTTKVLTSGGTGADPSWQPVSASAISWTEVTGTTQTMSVNNGYIANNASQVALTLPATSSVGDTIYVIGKGAGGWAIKSNAAASAQTINYSGEASPTSSSSAINLRISTFPADGITLICVTANSVWNTLDVGTALPYIVATGGTITTDGDYKVHTFNSSGTFTITAGSGPVDSLIIAGGGAGSANGGGGGGAGGMVYTTGTSMTAGAYSVTVGAGGTGPDTNGASPGGNGTNSSFNSITATGGGGGGASSGDGQNGGSGGGGSLTGGTTHNGGTGTVGQGNNGGTSAASSGGSGGGGAGAVGANAATGSINNAGAGGAGTANSITGASVTYAGGGGGSGDSGGNGAGGAGGGGTGGAPGSAGTANTGGGGGGSRGGTTGGSGGSGVVIIRYQFQT